MSANPPPPYPGVQPSAPVPEDYQHHGQPRNAEGYPLYNYDQTSPLAGTAAPGYAATSYPNYPNTGGGAYDSSAYGAHPGHTGSEQLYDDNTQQGRTVEDNQWNVSSFSDKRIRQAFIKKVYLILMTQLGFTFGIVCFFSFYQPIKDWMHSGTNQAVYWVSYAVFLVTYIVLVCIPSVRRKVPGNYICLAVFTLALTYMAATISSFHSTYIVVVALGITAAVCLAISLFAIQTRVKKYV